MSKIVSQPFLRFVRPIPSDFEGKGPVSGYSFVQIKQEEYTAYMYKVTCKETQREHFIVFKHKEVVAFNWETREEIPNHYVVKIPRSEDYGTWAWAFVDKQKANLKYNQLCLVKPRD